MKGIQCNYMENNTNIKTELIIAGSMVAVTLVSAAVLSSVRVNADTDTVDEVSITVPSACTMSGNIATGNEHTASINPNTYQNNIGKTTITTFCNDAGGYAIYAIGYTGNEYTGEDHTKLIGTNTNQKISTGTAKTGTSQWAMRITPVTGTYAPTIENNYDSENYHIIPDSYEKVATYGNSTDATGGTGSSIETTYAAYISGTQAADTYTGKVKYTLVHPATEVPLQPQATEPGYIAYYPNAKDTEGTMGRQSLSTSDTSATLIASNFSRTGYGFAGWSDKFDYATNPDAKFYGPNETINFTAGQYSGTNNGLSLYAVWVKSQGNLQDSAKVASVCNSLTAATTDITPNLSSVSALADQRDNNTYAIAKLADDKCWMIENLRLEAEATRGAINESLAQGYGKSETYGNFIGLADAENTASSIYNPISANSIYYSGTQEGTASIDIGTTDYASDRMPRYSNLNTQNRSANYAGPDYSGNADYYFYSGGNNYSWAAAMANTSNFSDYRDSNLADTSICPRGWRLPVGDGTNVDYGYLDRQLGGTGRHSYDNQGVNMSNKYRGFPNNFIVGNGTFIFAIGRQGFDYYWSTSKPMSPRSSTSALLISKYEVYPGDANTASADGAYIRCLAL